MMKYLLRRLVFRLSKLRHPCKFSQKGGDDPCREEVEKQDFDADRQWNKVYRTAFEGRHYQVLGSP